MSSFKSCWPPPCQSTNNKHLVDCDFPLLPILSAVHGVDHTHQAPKRLATAFFLALQGFQPNTTRSGASPFVFGCIALKALQHKAFGDFNAVAWCVTSFNRGRGCPAALPPHTHTPQFAQIADSRRTGTRLQFAQSLPSGSRRMRRHFLISTSQRRRTKPGIFAGQTLNVHLSRRRSFMFH